MKNKIYVTVGSVHVPVPLGNLSIRGWGPKRKRNLYTFVIKKVKVKNDSK